LPVLTPHLSVTGVSRAAGRAAPRRMTKNAARRSALLSGAFALGLAGGCTSGGDAGAGSGGASASGGHVASSGGAGPSGSGGQSTSSGGTGPSGSGGSIAPASGGSPGSGGEASSGSGGRTASGGTGGTAEGGAGTSGTGGVGGRASSSGGAAAGEDGGGGKGGRAGGGGGLGGGGRSGGAGEPGGSDPRAAAEALDGFALLKPCFAPPSGCCCDENTAALLDTGMAPENQHLMKQFGGEANVTYNVKLRVVGVAERYWYSGGMLDPVSKIFYTGGLPTIHSTQAPNNNLSPGQGACKIHPPQTDKSYPIPFTVPPEVAPADNCYNGFNIFAMTVSSPKQTYFLNYTTDVDSDRQPHSVYKTDYTVSIPIAGQAKIDFYVIDGDHHQVANTNMSVPNVKTTTIKQPYSGNFLELQVVDVTRGN